ncbi:Mth938-like domain-containing protein [Limimaricola variabilis]|uniref:Mth938-like domain-containing protein n=1 Tax=Limimaricola variabilis TaxID=1492771 RepID=UPI002AC991EB|nr:Mth938-like domain-containing protein [Limimaricola variabilis]WPY95547.1 Mth938-like domain-containing protein [Limimaricola variabilis]
MRMTEIDYDDSMPIDGYGPGFFRIGGKVVEGAVTLSPTGLKSWGGYEDLDAILTLVGRVDVLFVGTGAEIAHAPRAFRERLEAEGLGVETMATPAACRTYNVLLSEGRRVAVALLPV